MKNKRERKYYILIAIIVTAYWLITQFISDPPALSTRITTTTALIAAVTFWLQLKRTENLNEANFIMNLNNQFISNKELTAVEHELELFYNEVYDGKDISNLKLGLNLDRNHADCQKLINYLVYMESLATIIQRDVMHLGVIDDLFAYRFFIAVNNPIVQKTELLPYANYYQGCFRLAEVWTKEWEKVGRTIPLSQFSLTKCDKSLLNMPVESEAHPFEQNNSTPCN